MKRGGAVKKGKKKAVKKRGGGMMQKMMGGGMMGPKKKAVKKRGGGMMKKKQMPTYSSTANFDLSIDDVAVGTSSVDHGIRVNDILLLAHASSDVRE